MGIAELFLTAVGLSMDAFAASVCKGLSMVKMNWKKGFIIALFFGGFQAGMPLIGYFIGTSFRDRIESFDHWIAFALLALIGANMIRESFSKDNDKKAARGLSIGSIAVLAVATSIDALIIGVTFAFLEVNIWLAIALIGATTFVLSLAGVKIGNIFGTKYKSKAELIGGLILVLLGVKILLEHLGIINI